MVDRVSFPNTISNKDESRYYLPDNGSRLGGNVDDEVKEKLRDDVENALEEGKFVLVKTRLITNWNTGDYYHQFITRVLDVDDKFTYKMYKDVINFIDPYSDSMDNTFLTVLHKDQKVLDSQMGRE